MTDVWRPIETAPKDGSYVLLIARDIYSENDKDGPKMKPVLSWWYDERDIVPCLRNRWAGVGTHWKATHWMPLPAPPENSAPITDCP